MVNPLHLPNPHRAFATAVYDVLHSNYRPLTEQDYFEATFHSKYQKRYRDGRMMGDPYLLRHMKRNWKSGKPKPAVLQASLFPLAGLAFVASTVMLSFPGAFVMLAQKSVTPKKRSAEGTREDVIGKPVFKLSRIVNCLAGSQQYHDDNRAIPVTQKELAKMACELWAMTLQMEYCISKSSPRIANSKYLATSFRYLEEMHEQLHKRKLCSEVAPIFQTGMYEKLGHENLPRSSHGQALSHLLTKAVKPW